MPTPTKRADSPERQGGTPSKRPRISLTEPLFITPVELGQTDQVPTSSLQPIHDKVPGKAILQRLDGSSVTKAGLTRDPDEVRKVIYDASKKSAYFKNQEQRSDKVEKKIEEMLHGLNEVMQRRKNLVPEEKTVDKMLLDLEKTRDLSQTIVVIDADAFYASVEELHDDSLKGKVFAVAASVILTASYEARKFGVRSGMATHIAKKLCPTMLTVKPDFKKYTEASQKIMDILAQYDANMAPASLDEAYLNVTSYIESHKITPEQVGFRIRDEVKSKTNLTVSCGVAPNCMLAKIAADINKPNGQYVVTPERNIIIDFMSSLRVRKIPGIGSVSERWLQALEVNTLNDVYVSRGKLYLVRNKVSLGFLLKAYLGLGSTRVEPSTREERKSIGNERTFTPIWKDEDLDNKLKEIVKILETDMKAEGWSGRTLSLGYKLDTFESFSRAISLPKGRFVQTFDEIYPVARTLLDNELQARRATYDSGGTVIGCRGKRDLHVRLIGLHMTNLRDERAAVKQATALEGWVVHDKNKEDTERTGESPNASMEEQVQDEEFRFKPFYTGGPSLNTKKHATNGLIDPRHQLRFDAPVKGKEESEEIYNCPICSKPFQMSLAEFNSHLDQCLNRSVVLDLTKGLDDEASKPQTSHREDSSTRADKRRDKVNSKAKDREKEKRRKVNTLESMWRVKST